MLGFDPRIAKLFHHIREAIDLLEQVLNSPPQTRTAETPKDAPKPVAPRSISGDATKLAYSVEEVRKIVGISRSTLYNAIGAKELRAVKQGRRTIVLAADLQLWLDQLPSVSGAGDT